MKKYELKRAIVEVRYKNRLQIKKGVSGSCENPEILASFDEPEEALAALSMHRTEVRELSGGAGRYYEVTEYCIEENEYDEDGEWVSGGDVLDYGECDWEKKGA